MLSFLDMNSTVSFFESNKVVFKKSYPSLGMSQYENFIIILKILNMDRTGDLLIHLDNHLFWLLNEKKSTAQTILHALIIFRDRELFKSKLTVPSSLESKQIYKELLPLLSKHGIELKFDDLPGLIEYQEDLKEDVEVNVIDLAKDFSHIGLYRNSNMKTNLVVSDENCSLFDSYVNSIKKNKIVCFNLTLRNFDLPDIEMTKEENHSAYELHELQLTIVDCLLNTSHILNLCRNVIEFKYVEIASRSDINHLIDGINNMSNLKVFHFESDNIPTNDLVCSKINHNNLKELKIFRRTHNKDFIQLLIKNKATLEIVYFSFFASEDKSDSLILLELPKLSHLYASYCRDGNFDIIARKLKGLRINALTFLDGDNKIICDSLENMNSIFPNLQQVHINHRYTQHLKKNHLIINDETIFQVPYNLEIISTLLIRNQNRLGHRISLGMDFKYFVNLDAYIFSSILFRNVTTLHITNVNSFPIFSFHYLTGEFTHLKHLKIELLNLNNEKEIIKFINLFPNLISLDISRPPIDAKSFFTQLEIYNLQELRIDLGKCTSIDIYQMMINHCTKFRNLTVLTLNTFPTLDELLCFITQLKTVKVLNVIKSTCNCKWCSIKILEPMEEFIHKQIISLR